LKAGGFISVFIFDISIDSNFSYVNFATSVSLNSSNLFQSVSSQTNTILQTSLVDI
jgi:hypothetical protein